MVGLAPAMPQVVVVPILLSLLEVDVDVLLHGRDLIPEILKIALEALLRLVVNFKEDCFQVGLCGTGKLLSDLPNPALCLFLCAAMACKGHTENHVVPEVDLQDIHEKVF